MAALDNSQTIRHTAVPAWLRQGETRFRLQTIVRLRWLAVFGQTLTVTGLYLVLGIELPIGACLGVIALSAWLNVALRLRYPASKRLRSGFAFAMLGYDILQLAVLLYLTGGLQNPFAFLLIAPVTVSASTLPLGITAALGALTILAATLLTSFHYPLPWFHHTNLLLPFPYVMGVWAAVVSGILFIGFYSWRTAEEARRMAKALAALGVRSLQLLPIDGDEQHWEHLAKGANPRFVVTNIPAEQYDAQTLYEQEYCARGEMENRIKEQQLYLFADRVSAATMRANQLRLYEAAVAYLLIHALRRLGLKDTPLEQAQAPTIRQKLLKIGTLVRVTVRKVWLAWSQAYPYQELFRRIHENLSRLAPIVAPPSSGPAPVPLRCPAPWRPPPLAG